MLSKCILYLDYKKCLRLVIYLFSGEKVTAFHKVKKGYKVVNSANSGLGEK
jgi:hypothetical protein